MVAKTPSTVLTKQHKPTFSFKAYCKRGKKLGDTFLGAYSNIKAFREWLGILHNAQFCSPLMRF